MDQNVSKGDKKFIAINAFGRFKKKIENILQKQNDVFTDIMQRINEKKVEEARNKIKK